MSESSLGSQDADSETDLCVGKLSGSGPGRELGK